MADEIKNTENQELDWDSPISKDAGEFEIPPIGEYTFTVANLEKTMSKSGNKMADLTISLIWSSVAMPDITVKTSLVSIICPPFSRGRPLSS